MKTPYLTSETLRVTHGFFGCANGVSTGIYAGLNCGRGSGDDAQAVQTNYEIVAAEMGINEKNLFSLCQIHSTEVVEITANSQSKQRPKADAMVTKLGGAALGIVTADCVPVLFFDPDSNIIGAAHAGWNGAVSGIIGNTIEAMVGLGAKRENIRACVGPCISQTAYEVGQEFFENFLDADQNNAQFFINGQAGKYQFNLPRFVITNLRHQEIHSTDWIEKCTYANDSEYFSYRRTTHRNEVDYGRQISVITNSAY